MTLTSQELDELRGHVAAGDRIAYYSTLNRFGITYGLLALGVVNNDTTAGAAANEYFLDVSGEEGVSVSNNELATISLRLMEADFARREALGGADLSVDDIQAYHQADKRELGRAKVGRYKYDVR